MLVAKRIRPALALLQILCCFVNLKGSRSTHNIAIVASTHLKRKSEMSEREWETSELCSSGETKQNPIHCPCVYDHSLPLHTQPFKIPISLLQQAPHASACEEFGCETYSQIERWGCALSLTARFQAALCVPHCATFGAYAGNTLQPKIYWYTVYNIHCIYSAYTSMAYTASHSMNSAERAFQRRTHSATVESLAMCSLMSCQRSRVTFDNSAFNFYFHWTQRNGAHVPQTCLRLARR